LPGFGVEGRKMDFRESWGAKVDFFQRERERDPFDLSNGSLFCLQLHQTDFFLLLQFLNYPNR
jgi:hypothetical protein